MDYMKLYKFQLLLVATLDAFSTNLVTVTFSMYLYSLQANNIITGTYNSLNFICKILSFEIVRRIVNIRGKKFGLVIVQELTAIGNFLMILTDSYWATIVSRCFCALFSQTDVLCKDLILFITPDYEREKTALIFNIVTTVGYLLGPMVGGYLHMKDSYCLIGAIAFGISLFNISLLVKIPRELYEYQDFDKSLVDTIKDEFKKGVEIFQQCDWNNWDLLLSRYLFLMVSFVHSSKFSHILKNNLEATALEIGIYTTYQMFLNFMFAYAMSVITKNGRRENDITGKWYQFLYLALLVCILNISTVISYELYTIWCVPTVLLHHYINAKWGQLYKQRGDTMEKINKILPVIAGSTIPFWYGVTYYFVNFNTTYIFGPGCALAALCVISWNRDRYVKVDKVD